jgi:antitoxin component of MazEF toxin-antitoxin module
MTQYSKPVRLRQQGGSLGLTIPSEITREMGLSVGDLAMFKREPDGLRIRIIGHPALVELAEKQEDTVAAE